MKQHREIPTGTVRYNRYSKREEIMKAVPITGRNGTVHVVKKWTALEPGDRVLKGLIPKKKESWQE